MLTMLMPDNSDIIAATLPKITILLLNSIVEIVDIADCVGDGLVKDDFVVDNIVKNKNVEVDDVY